MRFSKKPVFIFIVCLSVFGGGYGFIWKRASNELHQIVTRFTEDAQKNGFTIHYDTIYYTGFPFEIMAVLQNPHLKSNKVEQSDAFVEGNLILKTQIWRPQTLAIQTQGKVTYKLKIFPSQSPLDLNITAANVKGTKSLWGKDIIEFSSQNLSLKTSNEEVKLRELGFALNTNLEQSENEDPYTFNLFIDDLIWTVSQQFPLPNKIDHVYLEGSFNRMISLNEQTAALIAKEWYKNGGNLDCGKILLKWGSLNLEGNGAVSLDSNLQPLIAFSAKIGGLENLLISLVKGKFISPKTESIAKIALKLLKESDPEDNTRTYHSASISLQEGVLSLGPFDLLQLPPIRW